MKLILLSYMSFDWAVFIAAIITSLSTITAIVIAWHLTKKSLYIYQQKQDLKKTEVRLVQLTMNTKSKAIESALLMLSKDSKEHLSDDDIKIMIKSVMNVFDYDIVLEEMKTIFDISPPTYKKYKADILATVTELSQILVESFDEVLIGLHNFLGKIEKIEQGLIKMIHTKTASKISELEGKKKKRIKN